MPKKDTTILKSLLSKQLVSAFEIANEAEHQKNFELREVAIHYIFDLLDWGRRNKQISDNDTLKSKKLQKKNFDKFPISVKQLEKSVETKLMSNIHQ